VHRNSGNGLMCEDCEQGEALMVVYSRKIERRGWRPPAKAATVPRTTNTVTKRSKDAPPKFSCERSRGADREPEAG
jgi:hypothetical protein